MILITVEIADDGRMRVASTAPIGTRRARIADHLDAAARKVRNKGEQLVAIESAAEIEKILGRGRG